ncbi:proline-rich family protein [Actinidia rufa]|uniref:Proline-rich family protein n=1 Tax=Actinidia rufa TaxID=165716 RepID=A0A7J0EDN2_9ERIC|nr:proline-rich family protein [Actinidia rufa]
MLGSELALLLVARGESEPLAVVLLLEPDPTLYTEEAGAFVIRGCRLPGMLCLISCSKKAVDQNKIATPLNNHNRQETVPYASKPYLVMFLKAFFQNQNFIGTTDFPEELLFLETWPSCFGGASFLMVTTLSTIIVLINAGLTSSLPLQCALGLVLVADAGLSGTDAFKFGVPSLEKPGVSVGFHGLDFTVGEVPRDEVLAVGVEECGIGLVRVEDLTGGAAGLEEGNVAREVGVDVLESFDFVGIVDCEVGEEDLDSFSVAGLEAIDVPPTHR